MVNKVSYVGAEVDLWSHSTSALWVFGCFPWNRSIRYSPRLLEKEEPTASLTSLLNGDAHVNCLVLD